MNEREMALLNAATGNIFDYKANDVIREATDSQKKKRRRIIYPLSTVMELKRQRARIWMMRMSPYHMCEAPQWHWQILMILMISMILMTLRSDRIGKVTLRS